MLEGSKLIFLPLLWIRGNEICREEILLIQSPRCSFVGAMATLRCNCWTELMGDLFMLIFALTSLGQSKTRIFW